MMAASAAFSTPFGYQTNVIVYQMGGYRYLDFVRIGLPLNFITFVVAIIAIRRSEEHTSELKSLMRISYAVFCLKKKTNLYRTTVTNTRLYTQYEQVYSTN